MPRVLIALFFLGIITGCITSTQPDPEGGADALSVAPPMTTGTPAAASFDAVDNVGVRQITVNGQRLLTGCGFGLIGSETGADDTGNITSCRSGNDGVMRPFSGASTPYLNHSLAFRRDPADPSKIFFEARVGPSQFNFATVSLPMDCVRDFTYLNYAGLSALGRYDQAPYAYTPRDGGPISIRWATGTPAWGEIVGVDYSIRVVITQRSRPLPLAFVEAPHLGVRNVEFSFGAVRVGQSVSVAGYIQVFRTDASTLQRWTYQSETSPYHQIGRAEGDGWVCRVGDPRDRFSGYGPYWNTLPTGKRKAIFRVMLDNTTADNSQVLVFDVYDGVNVLARLPVTRRMFNRGPRVYSEFTLDFVPTPGRRIELRTLWRGYSWTKQDRVMVL